MPDRVKQAAHAVSSAAARDGRKPAVVPIDRPTICVRAGCSFRFDEIGRSKAEADPRLEAEIAAQSDEDTGRATHRRPPGPAGVVLQAGTASLGRAQRESDRHRCFLEHLLLPWRMPQHFERHKSSCQAFQAEATVNPRSFRHDVSKRIQRWDCSRSPKRITQKS